MKKLLAVLCALFLITTLFAACTDRSGETSEGVDDESQSAEEDDQDEPAEAEEPGSYSNNAGERPSVEEAVENNQNIDLDALTLKQLEDVASGDQIAIITTNMGDIHIKLFPQEAPKAVENFTTLVDQEFFVGKPFHYVVGGYMVQSGANNSIGTGSTSIYTNENEKEVPYEDEFSFNLWNFRGAVSCVNNNLPDNNGSQFLIVQSSDIYGYSAEDLEGVWPDSVVEQYKSVGGAPHFDWNNTVFGHVVHGMDVVDEIAALEVDEETGAPLNKVVIEKVTVITADDSYDPAAGAADAGETTGEDADADSVSSESDEDTAGESEEE